MNVNELKAELVKRNVPEDWYSLLKGGFPSETLCLIYNENCWQIYYSERGKKSGLRLFTTESEACYTFLKIIEREL